MLQYVFALVQGPGTLPGHLYRSDNYGKPGSWEDMADKFAGATTLCRATFLNPWSEPSWGCWAFPGMLFTHHLVRGVRLSASCPAAALPEPDKVGVAEVLVSPSDPQRIFFQGSGNHHYYTTDFGATIRAVPTPAQTDGATAVILLHPRQPDWILTKVWFCDALKPIGYSWSYLACRMGHCPIGSHT
jgi:Sortilin, neurotensin receptor 3,